MATNVLILQPNDQGHFFFLVKGNNLAVGENPNHTEVILRDVKILRIRCEIEIDADNLVVTELSGTAPGQGTPHSLQTGQELSIGHSLYHLIPGSNGASTNSPEVVASPASSQTAKQLHVIDGANQGRAFRLPASGTITIGKSVKHADIILNDLYVSRQHCEILVHGDTVLVTHREGDNGTLVNGKRITQQQELQLGEILRVGNSHLRLETVLVDELGKDLSPESESETLATEEPDSPDPLEVSGTGATSTSEKSPTSDPLLSLEGQVLGRYRIGPLLGRGYCGVVFKAQDLKSSQVVALKVLSSVFPANGPELERFVQPLKILPQLHHPNLVSVYGAGRSGSNCWIAREFVEGESLSRLIHRLEESGKFNWTRPLRVGIHLSRALAFLHKNKINHGNITPSNILLRAQDKQTKLADLMLNRALEGSVLQERILEKKLFAEMPYLAPEQVDPDTFVDHLADLYGMGAVLYHLLTGRPPFSADNPQNLITQIREAAVVRPSNYVRGIPGEFEAAILKLLAKHQEDRYATAMEFQHDLEAIRDENSIEI